MQIESHRYKHNANALIFFFFFFSPFFSKGVRDCQGGETSALYICSLPPPERHQDPKGCASPLGSRERQKTNPLCRHHTGSDLVTPFFKLVDAFETKEACTLTELIKHLRLLFCLFLSFRSAG